MKDDADFSNSRFMESFESRHSDHSFTARLGSAVGIIAPPLRLDSQAKYGACLRACHRSHYFGLLSKAENTFTANCYTFTFTFSREYLYFYLHR